MIVNPFALLTPHPEDPRVGITTNYQQFISVKDRPEFEAAIWHNPFGEEKESIRAEFDAIRAIVKEAADRYAIGHPSITKMIRKKILSVNFKASANADGSITCADFPANHERVRNILLLMPSIYSALTGRDKMMVESHVNIRTQNFHDHRFPVLNCTFSGLGAIWQNALRKILVVDTLDMLFMKPGFMHGSSDGDRITGVTGPDLLAHLDAA